MSEHTMPSGEVHTLGQTRQALVGFAARAVVFVGMADMAESIANDLRGEAAALLAHADALEAAMVGHEVDQATLAKVAQLREQAGPLVAAAVALEAAAKQLTTAANGLQASAETALTGINRRHAAAEEASQAAPEGGADKTFYVPGAEPGAA